MKGCLIFEWLKDLGQWGETPEGVMRQAFSREEQGAREYVTGLMKKFGMSVRMDEAANIIGRYPGSAPELPAVAMGSHLDSVPNGGKYDGVLGVLSGLEVVRHFQENNLCPKYPLEIIVFSNEEGSRFSSTLFGSSVMMGDFNKSAAQLREIKDQEGLSLAEALQSFGGSPEKLALARREPGEFKAFLELHIEQGAVLEEQGAAIGIVEGISAPVRYVLTLKGKADHAGATPMPLRRDALVGAAEIVVALEKIVTSVSPTGVGTVGQLTVRPGAVNIIPGAATLSFDIRDINLADRKLVVGRLQETIERVCRERKLTFELQETFAIDPVMLDRNIADLVEQVSREQRVEALRMVSGAAHDCMVMANHVPAGMIFLPSVGGISHSPAEYTRDEDIITGVLVLREVVKKLVEL